jgi:hypothetical protein
VSRSELEPLSPLNGRIRNVTTAWLHFGSRFSGSKATSACPSGTCGSATSRSVGMSTALEVDAILCSALIADPHDRDVLGVALNERFSETGRDHPIPYSDDTPDDR